MTVPAAAETVLLLNRRAGSGSAGRFWDRCPAVRRLPGELIAAETPAEASAAMDRLVGQGTRRIVAVGGDGTFHHLVNEVMRRDLAADVELGLLPLGTGSDLARALGIPRRPDAAIRHLLKAPPRPMDLLRVDLGARVRHAANVASLGLSAEVAHRVNQQTRRWAGSYLEAAIRQLLRSSPRELSVSLDGEPWFHGPVWLVVAANGHRFAPGGGGQARGGGGVGRGWWGGGPTGAGAAGGLRISPGARVDDGLADCLLASSRGPWSLMPHLPRLYLGLHLGARPVRWRRATRLSVEGLADQAWLAELDGETYPATRFDVSLLPAAVKVLA
ncbi:MAG: hypothetical protein JJT90_06040 [Ectothiorhodospiraceae bacterium]|nr:hypothetical protein [Ectothiorhodospiraceae bacterium]